MVGQGQVNLAYEGEKSGLLSEGDILFLFRVPHFFSSFYLFFKKIKFLLKKIKFRGLVAGWGYGFYYISQVKDE